MLFTSARHRILALAVLASSLMVGPAATASESEASSPYGSAFVVRKNGDTTAWSTSGSAPTITSLATGHWRVRLPGITGTFGVAHVSAAPGVAAATCSLDKVGTHNGAAAVWVRCWNSMGSPANAGFAASYTSVPGAGMGWGTADKAGSSIPYVPTNSYNWKGLATTAASLPQDGTATMSWAGLGTSPSMSIVTPVSVTPRVCGPATTFAPAPSSTAVAAIVCHAATDGVPTDTNHMVHFITSTLFATAQGKNAFGFVTANGQVVSKFSSAGGVTVTHPEAGRYVVKLGGGAVSGAKLSHVQAALPGLSGGSRCNSAVANASGGASVTVRCWASDGSPADAAFSFQYFGAA